MRKQVGRILVESDIISEKTLDRALEIQKLAGKRIGAILQEMGVVTDTELVIAIASQFGMKRVKDFASNMFSQNLLNCISEDLVVKKLIFPLKLQGMALAVAISDPYDFDTLDYLAKKTNLEIIPVLATPADIMAAIRKHYLKVQGCSDKLKILVIDDSRSVVMVVEAALTKEGYEVITASDGLQGMKLAISAKPDLIISDMVMPKMDGYGLFNALKAIPATTDIPIILLTATDSPEEEHKALKAGFIDFIAKPVMPIRMIARVNRALGIMGLIKKNWNKI